MTWRWRGLCKKEWILMRWQMIGFLIAALLVCFFSLTPVLGNIHSFQYIDPDGFYKMMLSMHLIAGPVMLFISLENEKKQPDVWFHSPASMGQILGAKVFMIVSAVTVSMVMNSLLIGIAYYIGTPDAVPLWAAISLAASEIAMGIVNVVFNTVAVLFVWILYICLQTRIGNFFAAFAVLIPIFIMSIIWGTLTSLFLKDAPLTLIGLAVIGLFSVIFFSAGTVLLDKKVRY